MTFCLSTDPKFPNFGLDEDFEDLSVENFSQLITDNKVKEKISLILSEYEYEKYTTLRVPKTLTIEDMRDLLRVKESHERQSMIKYFYNKQIQKSLKKKFLKRKSEIYWSEKQKLYSERSAQNIPKTGIFDDNGNIVYGLWHNSLFTKFLRNSFIRFHANRLRIAALFGQKLIIDLDFDPFMRLSECRSLAQQLQFTLSYNKYRTKEPFDIHFVNCNQNMPTMGEIPHYIQNWDSPSFMSTFHKESYLDLFPKEQLVYITQSAPQPLKDCNEDYIYILAGHVSKSCRSPLAYLKAKKEGIRVYRLPTDEHVLWEKGSNKNLCLNHMIPILHDMKLSGDWKKSINHNIPNRKKKKIEEIEYEDKIREQSYKRRIRLENTHKNRNY